jgi:UDP-N-acetylmuramoyl-L-alanyl-D-glutamate--2,6-diaminopimelate ligase
VLTDDNPRGESAAGIVADILEGVPSGMRATILHDREQAIRAALEGAAMEDLVLIAGKGHEEYQIIGSERRSFSDRAVVQDWARGAVA